MWIGVFVLPTKYKIKIKIGILFLLCEFVFFCNALVKFSCLSQPMSIVGFVAIPRKEDALLAKWNKFKSLRPRSGWLPVCGLWFWNVILILKCVWQNWDWISFFIDFKIFFTLICKTKKMVCGVLLLVLDTPSCWTISLEYQQFLSLTTLSPRNPLFHHLIVVLCHSLLAGCRHPPLPVSQWVLFHRLSLSC